MRIPLACVALLALLPSTLLNAADQDFRQVVLDAVKSHPVVQQRSEELESNRYSVKEAQGPYWPSLDAVGATGYELADNTSTRVAVGSQSDLWRSDGGLQASLLVFDGGDRSGSLGRAKADRDTGLWRLQEAKERVAMAAIEAFVDVGRYQKIAAIYDDEIKEHEIVLDKVDARIQGGVGRRSELELAAGRLALSRARKNQALGRLAESQQAFLQAVGYPTEGLLPLPPLPDDLPPSLSDDTSYDIDQNPELQAEKARVIAAEQEERIAESAFFPTVTVDADAYRGNHRNGLRQRDLYLTALVNIQWNLFNGLADRARMNSSRAQTAAQKRALEVAERRIHRGLESNLDLYRISDKRIPQLSDHRERLQALVKNYRKEFEVQERTLFDVLNAQVEYFRSQIELVDAEADQVLNGYRVLWTRGVLGQHFGY